MRRSIIQCLAAVLLAPSAAASVSSAQSLNFSSAASRPRGEDCRSADDVLVDNLLQHVSANPLAFDISDFSGADRWRRISGRRSATISMPASASAYLPADRAERLPGFDQRNGTEIEQDLKLRVVPFTATVRFLPLGPRATASSRTSAPASAILNWRYSESGEFVDATDATIFRGTFVGRRHRDGSADSRRRRVPVGPWASAAKCDGTVGRGRRCRPTRISSGDRDRSRRASPTPSRFQRQVLTTRGIAARSMLARIRRSRSRGTSASPPPAHAA